MKLIGALLLGTLPMLSVTGCSWAIWKEQPIESTEDTAPLPTFVSLENQRLTATVMDDIEASGGSLPVTMQPDQARAVEATINAAHRDREKMRIAHDLQRQN